METNVCPKTWMAESILVTLFCCLPFGIVGIVNASKVSSLYAQGDYDAAEEASENAGRWVKYAFWIGLILAVVGFACYVLGIAAMFML